MKRYLSLANTELILELRVSGLTLSKYITSSLLGDWLGFSSFSDMIWRISFTFPETLYNGTGLLSSLLFGIIVSGILSLLEPSLELEGMIIDFPINRLTFYTVLVCRFTSYNSPVDIPISANVYPFP